MSFSLVLRKEVKRWGPFLPGLLGIFSGFCPDFQGFCSDFQQIKILVMRLHSLHPRLLPDMSLDKDWIGLQFFFENLQTRKIFLV